MPDEPEENLGADRLVAVQATQQQYMHFALVHRCRLLDVAGELHLVHIAALAARAKVDDFEYVEVLGRVMVQILTEMAKI